MRLTDILINSTTTDYIQEATTREVQVRTTGTPQDYPGPLTPIHYIVIVLVIYMGGIAVLIMKSVQRENEVLRYQHYYENFVQRPQFNRPQLLPSYTLRKASHKSRIDRGSSTPSHVGTEMGSSEVFDQLQLRRGSDSSISETKLNKGYQTELQPPGSLVFVKAMPASTQTDPL